MLKYDKSDFEKKAAKQKAFDYCMYMMLTSYFTSSKCLSHQIESQLFLYYKDIREKNQYEMESQCVKLIETQILPNVPSKYLGRKACVRLIRNSNTVATDIVIHTPNYILIIRCPLDGKNTSVLMKQYFRQR